MKISLTIGPAKFLHHLSTVCSLCHNMCTLEGKNDLIAQVKRYSSLKLYWSLWPRPAFVVSDAEKGSLSSCAYTHTLFRVSQLSETEDVFKRRNLTSAFHNWGKSSPREAGDLCNWCWETGQSWNDNNRKLRHGAGLVNVTTSGEVKALMCSTCLFPWRKHFHDGDFILAWYHWMWSLEGVRLPPHKPISVAPVYQWKGDGGGYKYLWFACPALVFLSSKCTLIFPEDVHRYPVLSPWSLVRGNPITQLQELTQAWANQCISSPGHWLVSGLGLWPNLALGVRPRTFVWSGGLRAVKEQLVLSGGHFAAMREEAVENEDRRRTELRRERTGSESVLQKEQAPSSFFASGSIWASSVVPGLPGESVNMFHFCKSLCMYYVSYASV